MDTLYCISCGTAGGEWKVRNGVRNCSGCEFGVLLGVNEMIDIINDLDIQGLLPDCFLEHRNEQSYTIDELDFDDDLTGIEQAIAKEDALRDMYDLNPSSDEDY